MKNTQQELPERMLSKPKYFLYSDECSSLYMAEERYTYQDYLTWDGRWELIDGIPYINRGQTPDEGDCSKKPVSLPIQAFHIFDRILISAKIT